MHAVNACEETHDAGSVGADRVIRTKTRHDEVFLKHMEAHDERENKIARHSPDAQETTHNNQPSSSSSSSSCGANRPDINMHHRQDSNDDVHKQYGDMNIDDKEKQSPTEVTSLRETQDDEEIDSKRQILPSVATTSFQAAARRSCDILGIMSTVVN